MNKSVKSYIYKGNIFNLFKTNNNSSFFALVVFAIVTLCFNFYLGLAELIAVLVLFLWHWLSNYRRNRKLNEYLEDLFLSSDSISKDFVVNSVLPLAILKEEDTIIWYNNSFAEIFYDDGPAESSIKAVIKGFPQIKCDEDKKEIDIKLIPYNVDDTVNFGTYTVPEATGSFMVHRNVDVKEGDQVKYNGKTYTVVKFADKWIYNRIEYKVLFVK